MKTYLCIENSDLGLHVFVHRHGDNIIRSFTERTLANMNQESLVANLAEHCKIKIDLDQLMFELYNKE